MLITTTNSGLPAAELQRMDTPTLRKELSSALTISAAHLVYLAAIWAELELRGEDLSDLRSGLAIYLPMIASGRVDAEAVVRFAGQTMLLRAIAQLPLDRQRALLAGEEVEVVELIDGEPATRKLQAAQLNAAAVRQVFDGERVRTTAEQALIIAAKGSRRPKQARLRINKQTRTIAVAGQHVELRAVIEALARAYPSAESLTRVLMAQIDSDDDYTRAVKAEIVLGLADSAAGRVTSQAKVRRRYDFASPDDPSPSAPADR